MEGSRTLLEGKKRPTHLRKQLADNKIKIVLDKGGPGGQHLASGGSEPVRRCWRAGRISKQT